MSPTAEGTLVDGLRRGDAEAAERVVSRYGEGAYRLAVRITRNAEDAEEIVEDAFWGAMDNIETFGGDAALGSWLYRVVVTAALQSLPHTGDRHAEIAVDDGLASPPNARDWSPRLDDPALQGAVHAMLNAAIDDLPANDRAVVVLHDVHGFSMDEIATLTHTTRGEAQTRLHRARVFLRARLAALMAIDVSS